MNQSDDFKFRRLPVQAENLRRKMRQVEDRAFDLGDRDLAECIRAALDAWTDAETRQVLARMGREIDRQEAA